MKATIVMVFSIFLISLPILGQSDKFNQKSRASGIDTVSFGHFFDKYNDSNYYFIPEKRDFFRGKSSDRYFDLTTKNRYQTPSGFKNYPDFVIAEEIPHPDLSTDNMPIIKPDSYGKLQIIRPDTTVKYYLKIIAPYNGIVTK